MQRNLWKDAAKKQLKTAAKPNSRIAAASHNAKVAKKAAALRRARA